MREIKFRAWKESEHRMVEWHELSESKHLADVLNGVYLYAHMQFTGLSDKNGKEIYEGDIVMVINYLNGKPWEGHIHPCEVIFDCGKFDLKDHWRGESLCSSTVEILGNIYENPELLKKDEKPTS